jgi:adenylate kinase
MNLIIMGIQGCGKGTQAALISKKYDLEHINIGNAFRKNIAEKTKLGKEVKAYIDKGELVPDSYVYGILDDAISQAENGFILDGFPRNLEQLDYLLQKYTIDKVILLDLPDEIAIRRISARRNCVKCKKDYNLIFNKPKVEGICDVCGGRLVQREDDNEATVARRLQKFHQETAKVIEKYRELELLNTVDADQTVDEIFQEIVRIIS